MYGKQRHLSISVGRMVYAKLVWSDTAEMAKQRQIALLCLLYLSVDQKYKSVELGDQLERRRHVCWHDNCKNWAEERLEHVRFDLLGGRVWRRGLETSRSRDFCQFFSSLVIGIGKFGLKKKSLYRNIWSRKKVSVSEYLVSEKKSLYQYRQIWPR